jgi:hypothetical protein
MIVMAYSKDYSIGSLCQQVNECYAKQHGYSFFADVRPPDEMINLIQPKLHFTWYKIYLLLKLMLDEANKHIKYFFWVDGDALVLDMSLELQEYITKGNNKDLIIAEDMHTCCLINAGVFFIKHSPWSLSLLQDVWECTKYNEVFYYEQSTIMKCLRIRKERLNRLSPFHSFVPNGPQGVKYFPHVAVFPHPQFSSNAGVSKQDFQDYASLIASPITVAATSQNNDTNNITDNQTNHPKEAEVDNKAVIQTENQNQIEQEEGISRQLIYHAAGLRQKLDHLRIAIHKYRLTDCFAAEAYEALFVMEFKLERNKLGHYKPGISGGGGGNNANKET